MIMADLADETGALREDHFLADDYVKDDPGVHMMIVRKLVPEVENACPTECQEASCQPGRIDQVGGKLLTSGVCTFTCSVPYGVTRYCGAGATYEGVGSIDCTACANPARCGGLPCFSNYGSVDAVRTK